MFDKSEYTFTEKLKENKNFIIHKGFFNSDEDKKIFLFVIIKTSGMNSLDVIQIKYECDIAKKIESNNTVKIYEVIESRDEIILVVENFESILFKTFLYESSIDIKKFLTLSIQLANALCDIHKHNIIHKNITPYSIFIEKNGDIVKVGDLGISSLITKENEFIYDRSVLEERLPYISPEQTGRMNCSVDYRTDFYSLGVTLYEMLTGRLPLKSNDPLELIHFHIAKNPIAPSKLNEDIPKAISDIVMKLLSKIPEERYQNSYGLKYDLEKCLKQLVEKGKIEDISIGENDISDKFYLPQKLYGREKEINVLLKTFDEISESKTKIMFVSGYSGIGKTTLINEIHKLVVKKKGYFVAGKFEQFEKDIPYNAIINAFQNLVRNILTENEDRIKIWRNKLLEAVGINGQIIVDVIPEVELIIGKQSSVAQLEPKETQNRFNMIFQKFIEVFSKEEHPLVLFLDDLQWIDIASLNLIDNIITDSTIKFFLIIGAYRDNEVSISHPLILTIDGFKKIGIDISNIKLLPLEVLDVTNLL